MGLEYSYCWRHEDYVYLFISHLYTGNIEQAIKYIFIMDKITWNLVRYIGIL